MTTLTLPVLKFPQLTVSVGSLVLNTTERDLSVVANQDAVVVTVPAGRYRVQANLGCTGLVGSPATDSYSVDTGVISAGTITIPAKTNYRVHRDVENDTDGYIVTSLLIDYWTGSAWKPWATTWISAEDSRVLVPACGASKQDQIRGANHHLFNLLPSDTAPDLAYINYVFNPGAIMRFSIPWAFVEVADGSYNSTSQTAIDSLITLAGAYNIKVLFVLGSILAPRWTPDSTNVQLAVARNFNTTYTSIVVNQPVTLAAGAILALQNTRQQITVSSPVTNATTIPVNSFTASATYAVGANVCGVAVWNSVSYDYVIGGTREPSDYSKYEDWVKYAIDRWHPYAIETSNEPNAKSNGAYVITPAAVVRMAQHARAAIDASTYPDTKLWGGTLAFCDTTYLGLVYDEGLAGYCDAISCHPYHVSFNPAGGHGVAGQFDPRVVLKGTDFQNSIAGLDDLHELMVARGDDIPIVVSEFGWSTAINTTLGVGPKSQGEYLRYAFRQIAKASYVDVAIMHTIEDMGSDLTYWNHNFGLNTYDHKYKKEAADIVKTTVAALNAGTL